MAVVLADLCLPYLFPRCLVAFQMRLLSRRPLALHPCRWRADVVSLFVCVSPSLTAITEYLHVLGMQLGWLRLHAVM